MKKTKTTVITLLSGKPRRIVKSEVVAVHEQENLMGGVDVSVFMKSGAFYLTQMSKSDIEKRITN